MGSVIDITERKEIEDALSASEERFRAIINQSTTGIAEVDLTGRFTLVNDRYCEIVGWSREELLRKRMHEVTHPEFWRATWNCSSACWRTALPS